MREIKFRAWDENSNIMITHPDVYDKPTINEWNTVGFTIIHNGYIKLMQYTGLKDKNGVEIYEGDTIGFRDGNSKGLVMFDEDRLSFVLRLEHEYNADLTTVKEISKVFEVIGNIYENKDLL